MALYVDSAYLADIASICSSYPVDGVTTNPTILLAAAERGQRMSDLEVLRELLSLCAGTIFMQPVGDAAETLRAAAERYIAVAPERVVPKLPPTEAGIAAGMALVRAEARISFTATCTLAQVYCAAQVGASWVIPYFGRLRRSGVDVCERVRQMARLLAAQHCSTRVLVASVKSPADLVEATLAGAHDVTIQPGVIRLLLGDPLTHTALDQFTADWNKLSALVGADGA